ncbi:MAG: sigma-54 interaction domain-containing protein [Thermoanaerobaculia bacterium]
MDLTAQQVPSSRRLEGEKTPDPRWDGGCTQEGLVGQSPVMQEIRCKIRRVAPTDATVFLFGETGTGKEVVARRIHELSDRRAGPFIGVNCGAIAPDLIESELFGHERGSFTGAYRSRPGLFAVARRGTLLLDEITEMPQELQSRLLRVLESGRFEPVGGEREQLFEARVLATTNRRPRQAVSDGRLRDDLFFRLNVFPMELPPLRERGDDVLLLARHFLERLNRSEGLEKRFTRAALERIRKHPWPGNVRQLKNAVQRAFILADEVIDARIVLPEPCWNQPDTGIASSA